MIKILSLVLILTLKLQAQVILVPSKDVAIDIYLQKCKIEGYQCTQDYFKQSFIRHKSVAFEQFIENLDLYSEEYRRTLLLKVKNLLIDENLNLEQVELLIKIINRFETIDKNIVLTQIKNELKELSLDLQNIFEEKPEAETYVLFNKFLTKKQYLNLKYKQKYTKSIKITPFTEPINALETQSHDLIQGNCENYTTSPLLNELKYTTFFENECGNSHVYTAQVSSSEFKWKNYEKPLIYVAAAALVIGLLSPYQIEVTY
jgi:hypothetical protein